jgi:hypothetical protein
MISPRMIMTVTPVTTPAKVFVRLALEPARDGGELVLDGGELVLDGGELVLDGGLVLNISERCWDDGAE